MAELSKTTPVPLLVQGKINPAIIQELVKRAPVDESTEAVLTSLFATTIRVFGTQVGAINYNSMSGGSVSVTLNYAEPVRKGVDDTLYVIHGREVTEYNPLGTYVDLGMKSPIFYATFKALSYPGYRQQLSIRSVTNILNHYRKRLNHYVKRNALKKGQIVRFAGLTEAKAFNIIDTSNGNRNPQIDTRLDGMHYDARLIKAGLNNDHALWFAVNKVPGNLVKMLADAPLEWVKEVVKE